MDKTSLPLGCDATTHACRAVDDSVGTVWLPGKALR